jgi:hypothetical protein
MLDEFEKRRLGAWAIGRAKPEGTIAIHDVLDRPCWIALGRHLPSTADVREPALWTVFGQESKSHPSARGDAASLRCSPPGLIGASLSARDDNHWYGSAQKTYRVTAVVLVTESRNPAGPVVFFGGAVSQT